MTASAGELSALVENEELGEVAYRRRLPEFLALPASEVAPVNLDVPIAVARAFGALAIARAHREELERRTKLDFALLEALEDYTLALYHVHAEYLVSAQPPELKKETVDEGKRLRTAMLVDAKALASHRLIERDQLKGIRRSIGFVNLANDLNVLARVLENYMRAHSKLAVLTREADIERAYSVSKTILEAVGKRRRRNPEMIQASERRDRVFTLFARAYNALRNAVLYLHAGDKKIARALPSLWSRRERKRQAQRQDSELTAQVPEQHYARSMRSDSIESSAPSPAEAEGAQTTVPIQMAPPRTTLLNPQKT